MLILILRIPRDTNKYDLIKFLEPVIKGGLFSKPGNIESIDIMVHENSNIETSPRHALIRIEPDAAARRVVAKLNKKLLNGKHVNVREFYLRSWHNDPRNKSLHNAAAIFKERRTGERRKNKLTVIDVKVEQNQPVSFLGDKKFHRTL